MACHPEVTEDSDCDSDMELVSFPIHTFTENKNTDLDQQVKDLRTEVDKLRDCLRDSLDLQQNMFKQWERLNKENPASPAAHQPKLSPVAASTPYVPIGVKAGAATTTDHPDSFLQTRLLEINNTSRVITAALHHANLEPPVFTGDNKVPPEDWLQAVSAYRASLNLTETQLLSELPRFLAKEPKKWFKALSSHITSWTQFCQLFQSVFLPSDNQERILRGLLDRVQAPDEPLPTFVAHMLSEFGKLKSPPPENEQIEMISKHSLEKYRVALYGSNINSVMNLLLHAHELHSVLGPSAPLVPSSYREQRRPEPHCFKCSLPGFTTRTCPNCNIQTSPKPTTANTPTPSPVQPPTPPDLRGQMTDHDVAPARHYTRQSENFRGGRTFHRGHPPSRR